MIVDDKIVLYHPFPKNASQPYTLRSDDAELLKSMYLNQELADWLDAQYPLATSLREVHWEPSDQCVDRGIAVATQDGRLLALQRSADVPSDRDRDGVQKDFFVPSEDGLTARHTRENWDDNLGRFVASPVTETNKFEETLSLNRWPTLESLGLPGITNAPPGDTDFGPPTPCTVSVEEAAQMGLGPVVLESATSGASELLGRRLVEGAAALLGEAGIGKEERSSRSRQQLRRPPTKPIDGKR